MSKYGILKGKTLWQTSHQKVTEPILFAFLVVAILPENLSQNQKFSSLPISADALLIKFRSNLAQTD